MTTLDPIQGLIDYVNEIKPFHTKILEVAVAYAQNDDVDITITDSLEMEINLIYPSNVDDNGVPLRDCLEGWGLIWDRQSPYIVVDASLSPQTISLQGNQIEFFTPGTRFEVREPTSPVGSPVPGSPAGIASEPPTAQFYKYQALSVDYDNDTNRTVIGARELQSGFLGSPVILGGSPGSGSPLQEGSPPLSGNEFFFPPYPAGSISNGDVFICYNVISTNKLIIFTRPSVFYGSPIPGPGSPNVGISRWRKGPGSPRTGSPPLPGSPKVVTGSPATYPNFGSPITNYNNQPTAGNTIVIKAPSIAPFIYGEEVVIRNAAEPTINRNYNILRAVDLGGSPELVELTVLDPILTTVIGSPEGTPIAELVFTPNGWSGGAYCSDVPPEYAQIHWMEQLDQVWRFEGGSPIEPGSPLGNDNLLEQNFQHFILAADSTLNTYIVQGDQRSLLTSFGSPLTGSPLGLNVTIQHAVSAPYIPFGSPKGFTVTLNANNGNARVLAVTYDADTNQSTLVMDSVVVSTPTGWITQR